MSKSVTKASPPICLVCQKEPTIRAHLLPECFVREIFHESKADEKHVIHHPETGQKYRSNTGRFDKSILCSTCDNILGRYEESAFLLIKRLRAMKVGTKQGTDCVVNAGTYPFRVPVVNEFIRFACGVLWKYASIPQDDAAHIDLGDVRTLFEDICFRGADIPEGVDAFIERDLLSFAAFKDPNEVYYYCTPSTGLRGTKTSHRMAWFSVGGFIIFVKLNDRGLSDFAPKKCWMRGRKQCFFVVSIRSMAVNRSIHQTIGLTDGDLGRLNKSIHTKYQTGELQRWGKSARG